MYPLDYALLILYVVGLLVLGFSSRLRANSSAAEVVLAGRTLTTPAFVASLVSTWYGGILGIGEYSYTYGLANWFVFGLPYYVAAALFAFFLARKARESEVLTIPERLYRTYGQPAALAGAIIVYLMTLPGAYVLIIGLLCETLFGWPLWTGVVGGTLFSIVYLYSGGFRSVVRTDIIQTVLMFLGFIALFGYLVGRYGGYSYLEANLPPTHLSWHGGQAVWSIAIWYVIALSTLIEPAFFQRCYAAKTPATARNGIFISIACWALFDFLTTSCGLYARALLPALDHPASSFPALAQQILPVGVLGLFVLALLTTAQSTVDSYLFISATTLSHDILGRWRSLTAKQVRTYLHLGLLLSAVLAMGFVLIFRSVVDIWYAFGSVGTPALLVPVFFSFVGRRRMSGRLAIISIFLSGSVSLLWYLSQYASADRHFLLGLPPIFPGLLVSLTLWAWGARPRTTE